MARRTRSTRRPAGAAPVIRTRVKFMRILVVVGGLLGLGGVSLVFGMLMAVAPEVTTLQATKTFDSGTNSRLFDRDGKFLAELAPDDGRVILPARDIDPDMKRAVVAIEDKRFYQHAGVDLRGLGRAVVVDVIEGRAAQGASTIEQQFVKVVQGNVNERTLSSKIRETALAYHLSHQWSKEKVLTEYLNAIYYGNGAYGLESAARTYFREMNGTECGTPGFPMCASQLRPAQAALLAGIINSPTANDPVANPVQAQQRRDLVLSAMRKQGMLNPVQYEDALAEPIPAPEQIKPPQLNLKAPGTGFFVGWIRSQLVQKYKPRTAFQGGLRVRTTLDSDLQFAAQNAISAWLQGSPLSTALVAIDNKTGEVRAMVGGQDFEKSPYNIATQGQRQPGSTFKAFVLAEALQSGVSPNSVWPSKKFTMILKGGEKFTVNNYDDAYAGQSTLARATAFSDNSVFARVGIKVGTKKIASLARDLGVRTPVSTNYAMTLGGLKTGVSPLDMAHAYETLGTGGKLVYGTLGAPNRGPVGIKSIGSIDGEVSARNRTLTRRVLPESIANQTTSILSGVVRIGSGKAANIAGQSIWGKTGTTENYGDAWFIGSNGDLTVAVWVGYPDGTTPMKYEFRGKPVAGGTYPSLIWRNFMVRALSIQATRRRAACARLAAKGKTCAEDKPAVPVTSSGSTGGGTTAAPSTSTGGGTSGAAAPAAGTGAGTPTPTPQQPAQQPATPATPATPNPGAATGGGGVVAGGDN